MSKGQAFSLFVRATAAVYLCLFPLVGLIVAYIGFCDPDTCWHLALGKWIVEHNQLPLLDPFSSNVKDFVFVAAGRPIMQHEWLSDWIFYRLDVLGGATLLLMVVSALSALSLIIAPSLFMAKKGVPHFVSLIAVIATVPACLFRLWVRPEVFSVVYLAALIWLLDLGQNKKGKKFCLYLLAVFLLFAMWANCHALFVLGLFYCVLFLALTAAQVLANAAGDFDQSMGSIFRVLGLTLAGFCGSLCTPWHVELWLYVLKIVFSGAAHSNKENGPIALSDLGHITMVPLAVSFIVVAALFALQLLRRDSVSVPVTTIVRALGMYICALACACLFRRFTPFAMLILLSALGDLFEQVRICRRKSQSNGNKSTLANSDRSGKADHPIDKWTLAAQYQLRRLCVPGLTCCALGLCLSLASTWLAAAFLVPPQIPSSSRFFKPACQALRYISEHRPTGRMLNDSKLGSMMTFCLLDPPDIFIDGRFDSYSRQLISDYQQMRLAQPGYLDLLSHYGINWVFFPPQTPLIDSLAKSPDWHVCYSDPCAVILARVKP